MGGQEQDARHQGFRPGPEHAVLQDLAGEFDGATKFWWAPGEAPETGKGTSTSKLSLGGLWLISDFQGGWFEGRGTLGYDPVKKKYVTTWIDSMMPMLKVGEGGYEEASREFAFLVDARDPKTGEPMREKWVTRVEGPNAHVSTFWRLDPTSGRASPIGEIRYTRRK